MESVISPTLKLVTTVRQVLERGQSLQFGLRQVMAGFDQQTQRELTSLFYDYEKNRTIGVVDLPGISIYKAEVYRVILSGLVGLPILARVQELEKEITEISFIELDEYIERLPLQALLPVLLLNFPAFLILIICSLLKFYGGGVGI